MVNYDSGFLRFGYCGKGIGITKTGWFPGSRLGIVGGGVS